MMAAFVPVLASFGLTVSEAKTDLCPMMNGMDRVTFVTVEAGQVCK